MHIYDSTDPSVLASKTPFIITFILVAAATYALSGLGILFVSKNGKASAKLLEWWDWFNRHVKVNKQQAADQGGEKHERRKVNRAKKSKKGKERERDGSNGETENAIDKDLGRRWWGFYKSKKTDSVVPV
jgi:hypothetical protein